MLRNLLIIIFLLTTSLGLQAQKELISGTMVTLQGETLTVKIKPAADDKLAKGISVYNDTTEEYKKYGPKDISYFKYDGDEYYLKNTGEDKVFMKKEIEGPATLFSYTYKVEKGNDKVEVTDFYVEKKEDGKFKLMSKKTFKNDMSEFYSDYQALAEKIKNAYYTFDEKEATVEEYNDWVAQGKPGKTWTKEDGNYTHNKNNDYNSNNNNNRNNNNSTDWKEMPYDGSKFAIDIPIMANYSIISSDQLVTAVGVRNSSNGFGYNVGLGLRWQLSKTFFWRNGFNVRMKRFHSNYAVEYDTSGSTGISDEYGNLHYFGMYSMMHMELGNFIMGAGFDISFGNIYRADYSIKDNTGAVIFDGKNESQSIIAQKNGKNNFNAQVDLTMCLGYKIRLARGGFNLKPIFQYSIPLVSLFDLDLGIPQSPYYNGTGVKGFTINLGVIVDIGFPTKPKAKSLLNE